MFFIVLLFPLLFLACGEAELRIHDEEYERKYNEEQELNYNYRLLKAYFYHPERIEDYREYRGWKVDSMYESLKDYFCGAHYEGDCEAIKEARYTRYYPPEKSDDKITEIENTPKYLSFGFERGKKGDTLVVSTVYPISPAFDAGLRKRDRLLFANGKSLTGENADTYFKNDEKFDDPTVFVVLRDGKEKTLPAMRKAEIQEPTVYLDTLVDTDIPYISVTGFKVSTNHPNGTYAEFKKILDEIKEVKTAIVDLRSNPGGNIMHCTAMAAELVPRDSMLLYDVQHYYSSKRGNVIEILPDYPSYYLDHEGVGINIKWIILMNRGSASCSERFAAAVKYNRPETVIIGQTSYGKGIGQIYTKTYLGGLAYITSLQTFYPDGETFHNIGIIPDIATEPGNGNAMYTAIINSVKKFSAAKRLPALATSSRTLPPERQAKDVEPGAYRRIETPLFHQGE